MNIKDWTNIEREKIDDPLNYPLFDEIKGCLESGFLRSAYIMSWIGIAENLKDKILKSSNLGDSAATIALKLIEDAETGRKSVDKIILDKAGELNLTDINEKATLEFLWTQRCVFAHPYQIAPSLDETKYIISKLVEICLSKPLLYKKGFLQDLIKNLVEKPFFLVGDKEKVTNYFEVILGRVTADLHPFLFKTLLAELGKVDNDQTKIDIQLKLRYFIVKLLTDSTLPLDDPDWTLEQKAVAFPMTTFFGCVSTGIWPKLTDRIKEILVNYALTETDTTKYNKIRSLFYKLSESGSLEANYQSDYFTYLDEVNFATAIKFYGQIAPMQARLLSEFDTGNFEKQNAVLEFLKSDGGTKFLADSADQDKKEIGNRFMYAVRNNNWVANAMLENLSKAELLPGYFVSGILEASLFNRINGFYIDLDRFNRAAKLLNNIPAEEAAVILEDLAARILVVGADSTHLLEETDIDAAIIKLEVEDQDIKDQTKIVMENLKPFKFILEI